MRVQHTPASSPTISALLIGIAFAIGSFPTVHAAKDTLFAERDVEATELFEGAIQRWVVQIHSGELDGLRNSPREYVRATVRVGNKVFTDVGIHIKGSAGSKRSVDDRPALSLKFNRFVKGQRGFGCEKLHLNNSVQDPSSLHENLASRLYTRIGIPTTRATQALLQFNGREMGIYVVKEAFDDDFIRRHYPGDAAKAGNLYEGGFVGDIDRRLQRDAGDGPTDGSDLERLRMAAKAPLKERWQALSGTLDTDRFLTLAATQLILDDRDGYVRNRNNYRIYFRGTDGRAVFMPHGMDQLLMHADAPIRDAWGSIVAQACFALPEQRIQLRARLRSLLDGGLNEQWMTNEVFQLQARLDKALEKLPVNERGSLAHAGPDLIGRIHQRYNTVRRELLEWPDPLASWRPGQQMALTNWGLMIQSGSAVAETNTMAMGASTAIRFFVQKPETRASFRTTVTLPAGSYRFLGRCKTHKLESFEDQFGRGAAIRVTGSSSTKESRLEGDNGWTTLYFDVENPEDGAMEFILEVRANRGEAWFERESLRIIAR